MAGKGRRGPVKSTPFKLPAWLSLYWDSTPQPLYCLVFLLPLVAGYEFGAMALRPRFELHRRLVAQSLLETLVSWFGPGGFWVPGVALLLTLLFWHLLLKSSWQVRAWVPLLMAAESIVLILPLLVIGRLSLQAQGGSEPIPELGSRVVLALGAGVYEELVFRLYLITALLFVLVDMLRVRRDLAVGISIVIAGIVFALAHLQPLGAEVFSWPRVLARTAAGTYLSLLFVNRGLGICTGCHAGYNLLLVTRWM